MAKILLIEDDSETAEEVAAELIDSGFEVEWASNGNEGLDKARSLRPDAMIVDRLLPCMDGLAVIETLRKDHVGTPVLVLRARPEIIPTSKIEKCRDVGKIEHRSTQLFLYGP